MADLDTRITPALFPDNIASLDGVTDETAPLVADATEALTAAYGYLGGIHDVRAAAFAEALAFAQKYAQFMEHPITLLPITAKEYVERNQESLTRLWDRLTPLARANAVAAYEGRFQ